ncbi:MAG: TonB-dependent receptor plug domain-containing protein [Rikenellaceae bacterium]
MNTKRINPIRRALMLCIPLLFHSSGSIYSIESSDELSEFHVGQSFAQHADILFVSGESVITSHVVKPHKAIPHKVKRLVVVQSHQQDSLEIYLKEITLSASFVNERSSPLRLKTISHAEIERKAIGATYPELLKDIPGIYATSESGSYGDAKINIRGFKQENISVMLNGIPVSGLVTGNMFWNNWLGLSDATNSIQVQKGIGASMLSDNSVGGTINIITNTTKQKPSFSTGIYYTDYGQGKSFFNLNTGQTRKGWAMSMMASYAWGKGYVEGSDINSWAYMLNVSKKINAQNRFLLTVLGSPERHQQRSVRLSQTEIDKYGLKYSKNWGYLNGKSKNLSENFYHKPYITLNHFYTASDKLDVSNTLYLSVGYGGGKWSESKGTRIIDYQKDGHINWDAVVEANKAVSGQAEAGSSRNILSDYLAGHTQTGFKSNISYQLSKKLNMQGGLHYQYYSTWEKERITDLLGGQYWYEDYASKSLAGVAGRNPIKKVGDYVRTNNGKIINHATIHISGNYKSDKWDIRGGTSIMWSSYKRWDKYNYADNPTSLATSVNSPTASAFGYSVKGGALNRLTKRSSVYLNAAVYSRLPYSDVFFSSGTNQLTTNVKNERNLLAELGYRYIHQRGSLEITGYWAYWENKTVMSDPYKQLDNTTYRYMVQGLDALHYGLEFNMGHDLTHWLNLNAYASLGNWKWKNDVSAKIYDDYSGILIDEVNVYSNGLPVGDAPQTQLSVLAEIRLFKGVLLNADWKYNSRLYADFDPTSRNNATDRKSSYRLPDYNLINIGLTWKQNWKSLSTTLFLNINNLLDKQYIERGKDGTGHTLESFSGYWGFGINGSVGIKIEM